MFFFIIILFKNIFSFSRVIKKYWWVRPWNQMSLYNIVKAHLIKYTDREILCSLGKTTKKGKFYLLRNVILSKEKDQYDISYLFITFLWYEVNNGTPCIIKPFIIFIMKKSLLFDAQDVRKILNKGRLMMVYYCVKMHERYDSMKKYLLLHQNYIFSLFFIRELWVKVPIIHCNYTD